MKHRRWLEAVDILKENGFSETEIAQFNRCNTMELKFQIDKRKEAMYKTSGMYREFDRKPKGAQPC